MKRPKIREIPKIRAMWSTTLGMVLAGGVGCYSGAVGKMDDAAATEGATDSASTGTDGPPPPEQGGVGIMGMRRLSRDEYDNTVRDLLGDDTRPGTKFLPADIVDPFDNDFTLQEASGVLIDALEMAAADVSTRLLADIGRRDIVVGCAPAAAGDVDCLESFVRTFGRRALRRPLTDGETTRFVAAALPFADQRNDFYQAVDVVVRAMLQHPHFVYRVETGTPTEQVGVFRLDDFEVATRLSYLIWGSTPDDTLLDAAEAGELGTSDNVRGAAQRLLDDPRALERIDRFHAMWLGYYQLPHAPEMTTAMRQETRALIEKVIFDDRASWKDLFTAPGSFVNDLLAEHYGLPLPGTDELVWVEYTSDGRQGLLSHGAFLSVAGKFGDTSPTQRGKLIRKRLLCQVIPPPPPDVNVDDPPQSPVSDCKWDRYEAHRSQGACKSCHDALDPVGFGLENYDEAGRYRSHDDGFPECIISGEGDVGGVKFHGPKGLSDLLISSEILDSCIVDQIYRFAMGHSVMDEDGRYVADLRTTFRENGHRFDTLVLALVEDEAFLFRREESEP